MKKNKDFINIEKNIWLKPSKIKPKNIHHKSKLTNFKFTKIMMKYELRLSKKIKYLIIFQSIRIFNFYKKLLFLSDFL